MTTIKLLTSSFPVAEHRHRVARKSYTLGINCVIALVMLGFGVAHVIGANILLRHADAGQSPRAVAVVHTD